MKVEPYWKIKGAICHLGRSYEEIFNQGDRVYYKREDSRRWRRPRKVLDHLRSVVL